VSFTTSRSIHTVARWRTPALVILKGLDSGTAPKGAITALERFFNWTIAGIALERRQNIDRKIPLAGAICALTIALKAFRLLPSQLGKAEKRAEKCRRALERWRTHRHFTGHSTDKEILRRTLQSLTI